MVALDWCARYRDDFSGCVIVNSSARPSRPFERFRLAGVRTIVPTLRGDALAHERAVLRMTSNGAHAELDVVAEEQAPWRLERPPERSSLARQLLAGIRFQVPSRVATPLLVLASTADALVSHRCSHRIAAHLGAPLRLHHAAGHDLSLDAPDWICGEIARWMSGEEKP
jgi:pimeloyl-ACP methyl ester carboxylesterase